MGIPESKKMSMMWKHVNSPIKKVQDAVDNKEGLNGGLLEHDKTFHYWFP